MKHDLAIVGAGPSGSWAATLLARRGARVLLLDPSHPREKPCGGDITGRALSMVKEVIRSPELDAVPISSARFIDSRAVLEAIVPLQHSSALVVASRAEFDGVLYEAARATGVETIRSRVTEISAGDNGFDVVTSDKRRLSASFLIGADGANSLVRRRLASAFRRDQLSVATGYFAHGVTSREIVIEMTSDPPGYIWSFPRPNHLAIGICAQADETTSVEALRAVVRNWIAATGIAGGARLEAYSWPIPSLRARDFAALKVSGRRWLTVGDAAGLVDPITREGIYFALQSAVAAADAISAQSAEPARAFADRIGDEILPELTRAARYKSGFFRPRFARLLIEGLRSSSRVRSVMADLIAGTQSYRSLEWRLAGTFEIGLAWRVIASRLGREAMAQRTHPAPGREHSHG